ncbi:MAG TPA: hemerythrin domain-containing protein [Noviherbaspirillum sp.]|jgi:hemerythrin superfamily protein|uniref:hemerythrin domain-containing protein n=1 Tax=Noviherbaspirillum sp. TaxID=1926288 RepID=UPI002F92BCAB
MPRNAPSKTASKTASKSARPAPKAAKKADAIKILTEDHRKVADLFDEFEKLKKKDELDDESKQYIVETACAELTIHAQLEEEIFYPAARDAIEDMDLLDEAEVEHASAKQLISELSAMQPGDDLYDAKFTVLGEYVKHHVEEEENELFKKVKKAELDLEEIGEEILQRRMELREELGIASDEEEIEAEEAPSTTKRRRSVH